LKALVPLLPYAGRYRLWIAGALTALVIAAGATLSVPVAVRQMIDHGFATESSGVITQYFLGMLFVVGVLALA